MSERQETKYHALIGRVGKEYYFLDYIFQHGDGFQGATGSVMVPLTEEEYKERVEEYFSEDHMGELWKMAVAGNETTDSLEDWIEMVRNIDGEENAIDRSYSSTYGERIKEMLGEQAFEVECVGGGRCFNHKMKFDKVYDQKLLDKILAVEKE